MAFDVSCWDFYVQLWVAPEANQDKPQVVCVLGEPRGYTAKLGKWSSGNKRFCENSFRTYKGSEKTGKAEIPRQVVQQIILPNNVFHPSKTGNFATWKFLVSQTDNKWRLTEFFDSYDYLSWPLYDPYD
jgi:hypothetical protein